MLFRDIILVFFGAGLGGVCRWGIGIASIRLLGETRFPFATFIANLVACALIGVVIGFSLREFSVIGVPVKLFLVTGFLGGLSTMSAFGLETVVLLRRGDFAFAGMNVFMTLFCCLLTLWWILRTTES